MTESTIGTIRTIGVIGAGQMGNGIAHVCALAGLDVRLHDMSEEKINAGLATIHGNMARQVTKGAISDAGGSDYYLHLADLASYAEAQSGVSRLYADRDRWARKAILNVACSGKFSSDRTIAEYAESIWGAIPCPID